jgi:ferredoxin-NADP reductase
MPAAAPPSSPRTPVLRRLLRHPLWAPLNQPEHWNRLASGLNRTWSFTEARARVVAVVDEAPEVRSLWLKPNARFGHFQPGQHVMLELDIDGARQARCFSLSQAPRRDGLLRVTIKRKPGGPVSHAAHSLRVGQVVRISRPQGSFAPPTTDQPLLLISAGSGITPMISHLHALAAQSSARDVVLVHASRNERDVIFASELKQLAAGWPQLRIHLHLSDSMGRLDGSALAALVPDWTKRHALLCGPDGFMRAVASLYSSAGRDNQLQCESFGRRAADIDPDAAEHVVRFETTDKSFSALAGQSLLDAAEAAGLQPRFGCRRGICRTCQCRKRSGTVLNLVTGQQSGPGDELIQLCISTPQSAIDIAL